MRLALIPPESASISAPLLDASCPGSLSPGWRAPPCGSCVPRLSCMPEANSSVAEHPGNREGGVRFPVASPTTSSMVRASDL